MNKYIFILIGVVLIASEYRKWLGFFSVARGKVLSRYWTETAGKITDLTARESQGSRGRTYCWTEIAYTFDVDGVTYGGGFTKSGEGSGFVEGDPIIVRYDPMDPNQCITDSESVWDYADLLIVPVLLVVFIFIFK